LLNSVTSLLLAYADNPKGYVTKLSTFQANYYAGMLKKQDTSLLPSQYYGVVRGFVVVLLFYLFLFSLELVGIVCKGLDNGQVAQIIEATSNPFITLFIGLLATAVLQSSSVTTSLSVTLVASGALSLQQALPFVMGANIGTTVTCAFVALAHITTKSEYRKAIAASSVHGIFNMLTAMVIFPLNHATHFLCYLSVEITKWLFPSSINSDLTNWNLIIRMVRPLAKWTLD